MSESQDPVVPPVEPTQMEGSWIQLDSKSKDGDSPDTSPKLSDDEAMTEALADAQNEMAKSILKKPSVQEEEAEPSQTKSSKRESRKSMFSLRGSSLIDCGYDVANHPAVYVSSLLFSHTLVFALGLIVGKKLASQPRL
ncbi:uncharacterized protein [Clytia hemisphaerica]|uniref:Uncharacterized protein n=1 Tax=Clytia hemisphaerica TaxID=252671 RepID=A0A7M6DLZ1_9CNID|eukprot:TCONS_00015419-protein